MTKRYDLIRVVRPMEHDKVSIKEVITNADTQEVSRQTGGAVQWVKSRDEALLQHNIAWNRVMYYAYPHVPRAANDEDITQPMFTGQGVPTKYGQAVNRLLCDLRRELIDNGKWKEQLEKERDGPKPGTDLRQSFVIGQIHVLGITQPILHNIVKRYTDAVTASQPVGMRPEEV